MILLNFLLLPFFFLQPGFKVKKVSAEITHYDIAKRYPPRVHFEEILYSEGGLKVSKLIYSKKTLDERIDYGYDSLKRIISNKETFYRDSFFALSEMKYCSPLDTFPCWSRMINSKGLIVALDKKEIDDHRRVIKEFGYDTSDTSKINSINEIHYNDKGLVQKELSFFENILVNVMVYEYDDNDRLIERSETPVNYITKKLRIKYGDRSRTEEEYLVYGNKEKLVNIDVYDAQGNLLSRIRYDDDGRQVEKDKFDYVYNKDKKLIEAIRFKNGKLIERTKYSYEYY